MSSLLIENVIVADGTGVMPFPGSVLIRAGRIAAVFPLPNRPPRPSAETAIVNGDGKAVLAPGFIDAHGHSDVALLADPDAYGKISQGVTTEVCGNCGLSGFPVTDMNREHLRQLYDSYGTTLTWSSLQEYAAELERRQPAINILPLCGFNTLRAAVTGYEKIAATPAMLEAVRKLLRAALREGAGGLSSGLIYVPGKFADAEEVTAALRVLREFDRPYTTHLRSEGPRLLEALDEAIACARDAGLSRLHISHFKTSGKDNWAKLDEAVRRIELSNRDALRITVDRYPYIESMTQLSVVLPPPYDDMDDISLLHRLRQPGERERLEQVLQGFTPERWQTIRLVNTAASGYAAMLGLTLEDIAERMQRPCWSVCAELLAEDAPGTMAAFRGMDHGNMKRILALDYAACGSDETARPRDYRLGRSHPRGFGSFPEFYGQLRGSLPMAEIIRKMTLLPAAIFGLRDRGRIAPGYAADLVLFNPDEFRSRAGFAEPHLAAEGIYHVFVNGQLSFSGGIVLRRAGQVLLRK